MVARLLGCTEPGAHISAGTLEAEASVRGDQRADPVNVSRQARLGRGLIAAIFAVTAAAISHSLAGGDIAGPLPVVLGLVVAMLVCVPLAARRLSWAALTAGVGVSQLVFHLLFEFFGPASTSAAASATSHAGHAHHLDAAQVMSMLGTDGATASVTHAAHTADAAMWIAHAIAALATLAMLRGGEAAIWRLIELTVGWAVARLPRLVAPITARPSARGVAARVTVPAIAAVLLESIRYRGPPALAA